jgi:hypothetical protein
LSRIKFSILSVHGAAEHLHFITNWQTHKAPLWAARQLLDGGEQQGGGPVWDREKQDVEFSMPIAAVAQRCGRLL